MVSQRGVAGKRQARCTSLTSPNIVAAATRKSSTVYVIVQQLCSWSACGQQATRDSLEQKQDHMFVNLFHSKKAVDILWYLSAGQTFCADFTRREGVDPQFSSQNPADG